MSNKNVGDKKKNDQGPSEKRDGGYKNSSAVKAIKNKSGVEGIRLLDPKDAKSWTLWSDEISSYVKANHHLMGDVFKNGKYVKLYVATTYDEITNDKGEKITLDAAQRKIVDKERITNYIRDEHEMNAQKMKVMGIIYQTISAESKYMLESHEEYDASKNDPLAAYNIL